MAQFDFFFYSEPNSHESQPSPYFSQLPSPKAKPSSSVAETQQGDSFHPENLPPENLSSKNPQSENPQPEKQRLESSRESLAEDSHAGMEGSHQDSASPNSASSPDFAVEQHQDQPHPQEPQAAKPLSDQVQGPLQQQAELPLTDESAELSSTQKSLENTPLASKTPVDSPLEACWSKVCQLLFKQLGAINFERWFEAIELRELDDQKALIAVPNSIYPIWIETNYLEEVLTAFTQVIGHKPALKFEICAGMEKAPLRSTKSSVSNSEKLSQEIANPEQENAHPAAASSNSPTAQAALSPASSPEHSADDEAIDADEEEEVYSLPSRSQLNEQALKKAGINAKFSLDNFVVGESNRYAFAVSSAVADAPGKAYNPLFLHSRSGLGKTHLLHAIGLKVLSRNPRARVIYRTSEEWVNEFLEAIERRSLSAFRARYRNIDVLLLDDVQFLAGKDHCKSEFFHTFNTLFDGHKQIVLSSDRPASEIRDLEPRLRSRFDCGLTAEMEVPNREVRLAILNSKAQRFAVSIKPEIMEFLAERISSDVRTLEGALVRVASYIQITQREPSVLELEHHLRDLLSNCSQELCINDIQRVVSEHFGVSLTELSSRRRQAQIVYPRQLAMLLSRQLTTSTLKEIGEAFGGRDHGTVLHAVRKLDDAQGNDRQQLQADMQEIKRRLSV